MPSGGCFACFAAGHFGVLAFRYLMLAEGIQKCEHDSTIM